MNFPPKMAISRNILYHRLVQKGGECTWTGCMRVIAVFALNESVLLFKRV